MVGLTIFEAFDIDQGRGRRALLSIVQIKARRIPSVNYDIEKETVRKRKIVDVWW